MGIDESTIFSMISFDFSRLLVSAVCLVFQLLDKARLSDGFRPQSPYNSWDDAHVAAAGNPQEKWHHTADKAVRSVPLLGSSLLASEASPCPSHAAASGQDAVRPHKLHQATIEDVHVGLERLAGTHNGLSNLTELSPLHADDVPNHDRIVVLQEKPVLIEQIQHLLLFLLGPILLHNHCEGMQHTQALHPSYSRNTIPT